MPIEDATIRSPKGEQAFSKGFPRWLADTLNPMKADMGGTLWRVVKRQMATIQAYIIMNMAMRMSLGGQSFHDAAFGSAIFWLAAFWYISWQWFPSMTGNHYHGEYFVDMNKQLQEARRHIVWSFRQSDPKEAERLLGQGYEDLLGLYKKLKPEALSEINLGEDLAENAKALLELSKVNPPIEQYPNSFLMYLPGQVAAVTTTAAAIPLSVATYHAENLNWQNVGEWSLITAGLTAAIYWAYSGKAWSIYLPKIKKMFSGSCEDRLAGADTSMDLTGPETYFLKRAIEELKTEVAPPRASGE
jgi:hypothetical protein